MTGVDIAFGLLAGILSCLTPAALLLLPLAIAAAGVSGRGGLLALAIGLGLSLVLTGMIAGSFGYLLGVDATLFRRVVCGLLALQGIILMSASLVERFPGLTGGRGSVFGESRAIFRRQVFRMLLLALLVGANWIPHVGPTLGKASLMAADIRNSGLALAVLLAYGIGAAVPWIVLGRIIRFLLRPIVGSDLHGMTGLRILGLTLVAVAILGGSGRDTAMEHWLDTKIPVWVKKLAIKY